MILELFTLLGIRSQIWYFLCVLVQRYYENVNPEGLWSAETTATQVFEYKYHFEWLKPQDKENSILILLTNHKLKHNVMEK